MGPELYYWYAGAHALICAWALWIWHTKSAPGALVIAIIAATLVYDNTVLGAGHLLGQGPLLEFLSRVRYAIFVSVGPVIVIAAMRIAAAARLKSMQSGPWRWVAWGLVAVMLVDGARFAIAGFALEPACLDGMLRYASRVPATQVCNAGQAPLNASGMPISVMICDTMVAIIGAVIWGKRAWSWLFIGSLLVFLAAKFPMAQFGPAISNASIIGWMLAFVVSSQRFASMPENATDTFTSTMDFNDTASFATRTFHKSEL